MAATYNYEDNVNLHLRVKPWTKLKASVIKVSDNSSQNPSGKLFIFKSLFRRDSYKILISDLGKVWYESLDASETKNKAKHLNPCVEAPLSKLLEHIENSLDNVQTALMMTVDDEQPDILLVKMETKLAGLPFVWQFKMAAVDSEVVSQHLVLPLLCMLGEYERQQARLFSMLKEKDKEIADLTMQGVKVSRRHLQTEMFEPEVFASKMLTSLELKEGVRNVEDKAFADDMAHLYSAVSMELATRYESNKVDGTGEAHTDTAIPDADNSSQVNDVDTSTVATDSEIARRQALVLNLEKRKQKSKTKRKKIKL